MLSDQVLFWKGFGSLSAFDPLRTLGGSGKDGSMKTELLALDDGHYTAVRISDYLCCLGG